MHEEFEDAPRAAYARLVADDDAPVMRRAPVSAVLLEDDADEPLDTLDARDNTEVDAVEEALEDIRRKLAGSWVLGALAELFGVAVNFGRMAVALVRPSTYRGHANPVVRSAVEQTEVDEVAEEKVVQRTRTAADVAKDIRHIARRRAAGDVIDPVVLDRVGQDKGTWLMALTTAEADRLAAADIKDIDLHAHNVAVVAGVRTPAQYESGIAAVISATTPKPPRLNAEIYRELAERRRRGPSMDAA